MIEILLQTVRMLKEHKSLWMAPILIIIAIIGFMMISVQGTVLAPFIYTLF